MILPRAFVDFYNKNVHKEDIVLSKAIKLDVFGKYIDCLSRDDMKEFVTFVITEELPNYFWTLPASTSGRRHGGPSESLVHHVVSCCEVGISVIQEQLKNHLSTFDKDVVMAGIMLHDGWRCGRVGEESRFTEQHVQKRNLDISKIGKLYTSKVHPKDGQLEFYNSFGKYLQTNKEKAKDLFIFVDEVGKTIGKHYGPFTSDSEYMPPLDMHTLYTDPQMIVHLIDFFNAMNESIRNKGV